jgi:hypothetical protein
MMSPKRLEEMKYLRDATLRASYYLSDDAVLIAHALKDAIAEIEELRSKLAGHTVKLDV